MPAFVPIQVLTLDLDDEVASAATWAAVRPGHKLWILGRRQRMPLGLVEIEAEDVPTGASDLRRAVESELGPRMVERRSRRIPIPVNVSVVVPTTGERLSLLERCLSSLIPAMSAGAEVIVVDNRPEHPERLHSLREGFPNVRFLEEPRPGGSAARNLGWHASSNDVIAFTDDDVVVDPDWLGWLVRPIVEEGSDCATGLVIPDAVESLEQLWFEESLGFNKGYEPLVFGPGRPQAAPYPYAMGQFGSGNNMAFRRSALQELGGFDPALGPGTPARAGEDIALFVRLLTSGGTLTYEPAALVAHTHRADRHQLEAQVRDYGTGLTAALTSLAWNEPRRHLPAMARALPSALRTDPMHGQRSERPAFLDQLHRRGMAKGPVAYAQSRKWWRSQGAAAAGA